MGRISRCAELAYMAVYSAPSLGLVLLCQNVRLVKFINGVFIFQMMTSTEILKHSHLFLQCYSIGLEKSGY